MGQRGRPRHPDVLTPREQDVLSLIRECLTNEQIAARLGITFETAKHHVSEILSKLGVETREEAAAWREERRTRHSLWQAIGIAAGVAVFAGAVAGLGLLAWGVQRSGTAEQQTLPSLAGILPGPVYYLPPDDGSPWISTPDLVAQAGVHIVDSPQALEAEALDPIALIIDKEWWDSIKPDWLSARESVGVIVVGGRIDIAGFNPGYSSDRNFYTFRYHCGSGSGRGQDYLDYNAWSQFRFMLNRIAGHAEQSQCLFASPSASPSAPTDCQAYRVTQPIGQKLSIALFRNEVCWEPVKFAASYRVSITAIYYGDCDVWGSGRRLAAEPVSETLELPIGQETAKLPVTSDLGYPHPKEITAQVKRIDANGVETTAGESHFTNELDYPAMCGVSPPATGGS